MVACVSAALAGSMFVAAPSYAATAAPAPVGNVTPTLTPVPAGKVAVVASSAAVDNNIAVIVQNGSTKPVRNVRIVGAATTPDGGAVTQGRTAVTVPAVLAPGAIALASLHFPRGLAPNATITYTVRTTRARTTADPGALTVGDLVLSAPLTGAVAEKLAVTVTNPSKRVVRGRIRIAVMCFDEAGKPSTATSTAMNPGRLRPGASTAASVPLTTLCPTYLVGAQRVS